MREFRPVEGSLSTKLSSTHYIALAALDSAMNNNNNNTRDRCFPFDHCGSINGKTFNLFSCLAQKSRSEELGSIRNSQDGDFYVRPEIFYMKEGSPCIPC